MEVEVFANKEPDDLLKSIQRTFDDPIRDLAQGPDGIRSRPTAAIGTLSPAALGKTMSAETANTLRGVQSYFGPYPYNHLALTNITGSYAQGSPGPLYPSWLPFLNPTHANPLGINTQL